tara:strand:- start:1511 stop:2323 length:813 start_codon:yes stop_codon:yes gene_type:complete
MNLKLKMNLYKILIYSVIIYLTVTLIIFFFQRKIMYHPGVDSYLDEKNLSHKIEKVTIESENPLVGWHYEKNKSFKTLLFFHGNAGKLDNRIYKLNEFAELNLNYLIFAYRGFSGNKGNPSENGLYKDAESANIWLNSKGISDNKIIIYGESLGTAVAIELSQNKKFAGIILESPFTSMVDLGKKYYPIFPVQLLLKDKYESKKKINNISSPILIIHGKKDKIVPFYMGEKLYELANKPKYNYFTEIDDHMMTFDEKLINQINIFINNLN